MVGHIITYVAIHQDISVFLLNARIDSLSKKFGIKRFHCVSESPGWTTIQVVMNGD